MNKKVMKDRCMNCSVFCVTMEIGTKVLWTEWRKAVWSAWKLEAMLQVSGRGGTCLVLCFEPGAVLIVFSYVDGDQNWPPEWGPCAVYTFCLLWRACVRRIEEVPWTDRRVYYPK